MQQSMTYENRSLILKEKNVSHIRIEDFPGVAMIEVVDGDYRITKLEEEADVQDKGEVAA